jgi:hypothetical protein
MHLEPAPDGDRTERIDRDASLALPPAPFEVRFRVDFLAGARQAHHEVRIPPGRPLVIESMMALLPGGPAFSPRGRVILVIRTITHAKETVHWFRFALPSPDATQPDPRVFKTIRVVADAGSCVEFVFLREAEEDARAVVLSARGHLVERP